MKNKFIPYNKNLKEFSKQLRKDSTKSEVKLWNEIKGKKLNGYKFNRQKPLLNYIVDFYCKELNLVIELDGITHYNEENYKKDEIRQKELEKYNLNFLRFNDNEVIDDINNVLRVLKSICMILRELKILLAPLKGGTFRNIF